MKIMKLGEAFLEWAIVKERGLRYSMVVKKGVRTEITGHTEFLGNGGSRRRKGFLEWLFVGDGGLWFFVVGGCWLTGIKNG